MPKLGWPYTGMFLRRRQIERPEAHQAGSRETSEVRGPRKSRRHHGHLEILRRRVRSAVHRQGVVARRERLREVHRRSAKFRVDQRVLRRVQKLHFQVDKERINKSEN